MKRSMFSMLFMSAMSYRMSDDAPAAVAAPVVATKESLLQRVEALFERGIEGVESALHDAIEVVENLFAGDDDATLDISEGEPVSDPAPDATPAVAADAAPATTGDTGNADISVGAGTAADAPAA